MLKAKLANLVSLANESEKLANPESEPDKYANMGYTEAVYDAIKSLWEARKVGATVTEIKNHLIAHGFKHGANFDTSVYTIINRLLEGARIVEHNKTNSPITVLNGATVRIPIRKFYRPK